MTAANQDTRQLLPPRTPAIVGIQIQAPDDRPKGFLVHNQEDHKHEILTLQLPHLPTLFAFRNLYVGPIKIEWKKLCLPFRK